MWVTIPETNHKYSVDESGHIRSEYSGKLRKLTIDRDGYRTLRYRKNSRATHTLFVHRAVAAAFIPNPQNKAEVNHMDGDKSNNVVSNLEWNTKTENVRHAFANNLVKSAEDRKLSKLTNQQVRDIRKEYIPRTISTYELARKYDVTQSVIWRILSGKTYKTVKEL